MNNPVRLGEALASNAATTVVYTLAAGQSVAVGDLILLMAGDDGDGNSGPTSATDSKGNIYQVDASVYPGATDQGRAAVLSGICTSALVAGDSITVTYTGISGTWDKFVAVSKCTPTGSWDAARKDKTSTATATTGANWDSGATTATTVASELAFGGGVMAKNSDGTLVSSAPGALNSELADVNATTFLAYTTVYQILSATGTPKANGTWSGLTNKPWVALVVTYKEAAGGGGSQTLTLSRVNHARQIFAHQVRWPQTLTLSRVNHTRQIFDPTLSPSPITLSPARVDHARAIFDPTFAPQPVGLSLARVDHARQIFDPSLLGFSSIALTRVDHARAVFDPTLTPQPVGLDLARVDHTRFILDPIVGTPPVGADNDPAYGFRGQDIKRQVVERN